MDRLSRPGPPKAGSRSRRSSAAIPRRRDGPRTRQCSATCRQVQFLTVSWLGRTWVRPGRCRYHRIRSRTSRFVRTKVETQDRFRGSMLAAHTCVQCPDAKRRLTPPATMGGPKLPLEARLPHWCPLPDSNRHSRGKRILSPLRLPDSAKRADPRILPDRAAARWPAPARIRGRAARYVSWISTAPWDSSTERTSSAHCTTASSSVPRTTTVVPIRPARANG